jgi:acetolactate synthase-1/2/3 large subunit
MTLMSAGEALVDQLLAEGIDHAFTVPGESFLGALDAMETPSRSGHLRVIATRHENGAAFMAEAYAQLMQRPALCMATRAPGAANLSIGIHTARQDSAPLIALVGQVERRWQGREAFQEVDLVRSFGRLAKWAVEVERPEDVRELSHRAVLVARSGRPGPVLVATPADLLVQPIADQGPLAAASVPLVAPPPGAVETVMGALAEARTPVIVAGGGILRSGSADLLVRVAEALEVPVFSAWRRPDVFPNGHRLYLGSTGLAAPHTVLPRLQAADVIVALGTRLSEIASFRYQVPASSSTFFHVDIDPPSSWRPVIAIRADARAFLGTMLTAIERRAASDGGGWSASIDARRPRNHDDRAAFESASALTLPPPDDGGVHPAAAVLAIRQILDENTIVTTDAGNFAGWAARHLRFERPGTFLGPTSGAMGYALPAAIAAAVARPRARVIALAGDGGFGMSMGELETAVREHARLTALVFDNSMYGTIRMHQELGSGRRLATDLGPVDFAMVARGLGVVALDASRDADVEPALRAALAADGPSLIHLRCNPHWLSVDHELADS